MVEATALRAYNATLSWSSPQLRVAYASTLAQPGTASLLIDGDNWRAGWADVADACYADVCHAVALAHPYWAVDIDVTPARTSHDVTVAAERIVDAAWQCHIPAIRVASGRNEHVYLLVGNLTDDVARRLAARLAGYGDVRRPGARIRPPGTRHRYLTDGHSGPERARTYDDPAVALATLQRPAPTPDMVDLFVATLDPPRITVDDGTAARTGRLSTTVSGLLDGWGPPAGARSETVWTIVTAAVRAGLDVDGTRTLVEGTWVARYLRRKQPSDPWARLTAEHARATSKIGPAQLRWIGQVAPLRVAAIHHKPPGRWWVEGGAAVLDVVLAQIGELGRWTIDLSVRDAATRAGISRSAAHRHLHALHDHGYLTATPAEGPRQAATYTVNPTALQGLLTPEGPQGVPVCPTSVVDVAAVGARRAADVFCWPGMGGLGHRGWLIWAIRTLIGDGPAMRSIPGWAAVAARLDTYDLPAHADDSQFETAAATLGVAGVGQARSGMFEQERAAYVEAGMPSRTLGQAA